MLSIAAVVGAPYTRLRPSVGTAAAEAAASEARTLLAQPVEIGYHGARLGTLTPAQIARALHVTPEPHVRGLDGEQLARTIRPRLGRWIVRAHNAQFVVNGDGVRIVPSRPGRDVDAHAVGRAWSLPAAHGAHVANVELGPA